jgi:hypothetical protein
MESDFIMHNEDSWLVRSKNKDRFIQACINGRIKIIEPLFDKVSDPIKYTGLRYAIINKRTKTVKYLIQDKRLSASKLGLHHIIYNSKFDTEIILDLIKKYGLKLTVSDCAASLRYNDLEYFKWFIQHRDSISSHLITRLLSQCASFNNSDKIVDYIIKLCNKEIVLDKDVIFSAAIKSGNIKMLKLAVDGATKEVKNNSLMSAIKSNNLSIVMYLVENTDVDIHLQDSEELNLALWYCNPTIPKYLARKGSPFSYEYNQHGMKIR